MFPGSNFHFVSHNFEHITDQNKRPGVCVADLSSNTASFAKSVAMLGSAEDNTALSRALSQLAEVEDKMEQLHQDQAANDTFSFAEVIADYIRLLGAVRVRREIKHLHFLT